MIDIDDVAFTLWAFDDAGRAIDPGAVASWWNHMATTIFNNLWAPGDPVVGGDRTTSFDARLTVHLVNPAEGPLDPDLLARVTSEGQRSPRHWSRRVQRTVRRWRSRPRRALAAARRRAGAVDGGAAERHVCRRVADHPDRADAVPAGPGGPQHPGPHP